MASVSSALFKVKGKPPVIDIDLFISANLIFPNYKTIDISNVNKQWNLTLGIEKLNKIIKKYKINNYNLFTYYNQMEKKQGKKLQKRRTQQLENNFSQTEESSIIIEKDVIHVKGYQNFTISNNELINPTRKLDGVKAKLVIRIIEEHKKNCKSLIDFGCSQGYYSFLSYFNGYKVIGYEQIGYRGIAWAWGESFSKEGMQHAAKQDLDVQFNIGVKWPITSKFRLVYEK